MSSSIKRRAARPSSLRSGGESKARAGGGRLELLPHMGILLHGYKKSPRSNCFAGQKDCKA